VQIFVIAKHVFLVILIVFGVKKVIMEWELAKILDSLDVLILDLALALDMEVVRNV